jgi:LCP family protein required for cell wall assembly
MWVTTRPWLRRPRTSGGAGAVWEEQGVTDRPRRITESPVARDRGNVGVFMLYSGKALLSIFSVVVLTLTWYGWQFVGDINEGLATTKVFDSEPQAVPLDGAIDILLVGLDSRTDAQGNPLPREVLDMLHAGEADGERQTDTMILVHIPQDGTRAVAISFPRDSWVEIAGGYGTHKLNSAFVYAYNDTHRTLMQQGEQNLEAIDERAKTAGRKNLIATVEQLIGRPGMVDRYAEVNLASFYAITQAIGGIEVCLMEPVKEFRSGIDLPAGKQTIKDVQALAFVRQRYELENGDLDRIARQQAFLSGLARKVISTDVLTSPSKISELVTAVKKSVVLSEDWDLLEFAGQMRGLSSSNIEFRTIPVLGNARIAGADVLEVDVEQVQAFVDDLVDIETKSGPQQRIDSTAGGSGAGLTAAQSITVEVFNGSGSPMLGSRVRAQLSSAGFDGRGTTDLSSRSTTLVRHAPGEEHNVEVLSQALGMELEGEPDSDVDAGHLRILLGADFPTGSSSPQGAAQQPPGSETNQPDESGQESVGPPITAGGVTCVN